MLYLPPISAFVGPNGTGKTLAAIELSVLPSLIQGRDVWSNIHIDHPNAHTLESWRQLGSSEVKDCVLMLDEISRVAPARAAMSMPAQMYGVLDQMRKRDLELIWTAPVWSRADSILRGVTLAVTTCRGYMSDPYIRVDNVIPPWYKPYAPRVTGALKRGGSRRWIPNSLFKWTTWDAQGFEEYSVHAVKDLRPLHKIWYYRPWHSAQFRYDTLEDVVALDNISDIGVCVICGGRRARARCTCLRVPARVLVGPPVGGLEGTGGVSDEVIFFHDDDWEHERE